MAKNMSFSVTVSTKDLLHSKYNVARNNLLIVLLATVINCTLSLLAKDTYFLFSAFVPYFAVTMGMILCGRMPAEYYGEDLPYYEFYGNGVFAALVGIAAVCLVLYFLAWFFSKNHKVGWLIFGLVFFALDTVFLFLFGGIDPSMIIDYLFHAWILFELSRGIYLHFKWKNTEEDSTEENGNEDESDSESDGAAEADSEPLRSMDRDAKARVLGEIEFEGHKICYRKVNKVNELVVDGMVYDEYAFKIQTPHMLCARVNGHNICAGLNNGRTFIVVDGNLLLDKVRWV